MNKIADNHKACDHIIKTVFNILKLMQERISYIHSDPTIRITSTGLCILTLMYEPYACYVRFHILVKFG